MSELVNEILFSVVVSVIMPISWFTYVASIVFAMFISRLWIITIISFFISLLFYLVYFANNPGGLVEVNLGFQVIIAFSTSLIATLFAWIGRKVARKMGLALGTLKQSEEHKQN